jgi:hypothetical protein
VLKNWNTPAVNLLHAGLFMYDLAVGVFHLYHHSYPLGLIMFAAAGSIIGINIVGGIRSRRRAALLEELGAAAHQMWEGRIHMPVIDTTVAEKARANLLQVVRATGATLDGRLPSVEQSFTIAPYSPVVHLDIPGEPFFFVIVPGTIYKFRRATDGRPDVLMAYTCYNFGAAAHAVPYDEYVASALLLVKNDPSIFERWCRMDKAYS